MKNKKSVMTFSAMMILIYHLWIYVFPGNWIEQYIRWSAFIGVDIFFMISAYTLSKHKPESYFGFVSARFKSVYIKFIVFAVVAAIVSKWKITKLLLVVCGVQLFQKGGGAFLWFLPAIMLFYLAFPFIRKLYSRNAWLGVGVMLMVWLAVGVIVSVATDYTAFFIFWNRVPALTVGMLWASLESRMASDKGRLWQKVFAGVAFLAVGSILIYYMAFRNMLQHPVKEMFYIMAIPSAIGIALLVSLVPENVVTKLIGSSTLEMYAIQMIFGYKWAEKILRLTNSAMLTNILSIILVTAVAVLISCLYSFATAKVSGFIANRKK